MSLSQSLSSISLSLRPSLPLLFPLLPPLSCPQSELLAGLEVGPNLGMVKSSSLESLHNIVAHTIKRDVGPKVGELRTRETRNSFRRAVDHSMNDGDSSQRGVDGERRGGGGREGQRWWAFKRTKLS